MEPSTPCQSDSESFSRSISQRSTTPLRDNISHYHYPLPPSPPPVLLETQLQPPQVFQQQPQPLREHLPPAVNAPAQPINVNKHTGIPSDFGLIPPIFDRSDDEPVTRKKAKDTVELIYDIETSTFRRALRSELLKGKRLTGPPGKQPNRGIRKRKVTEADGQGHGDFFYTDIYNPPMLVDGRKTVMHFPRFKRTIKIYYRVLARVDGEKSGRIRGDMEVIVRRLKLPIGIWLERNVLGRWDELWLEMY